MQLLTIIDPRDNLEKANRWELAKFANEHGLKHITDADPAIKIRKELRARGLVDIKVPNRQLGLYAPKGGEAISDTMISTPQAEGQTVDADDAFLREHEVVRAVESMSRKEMQDECKKRGIKMERTDTNEKLKAKLLGG